MESAWGIDHGEVSKAFGTKGFSYLAKENAKHYGKAAIKHLDAKTDKGLPWLAKENVKFHGARALGALKRKR